jgi:two-component system response regulator NreC
VHREGDEEITVMLADDHAVVRAGLRMVLEAEEDMTVVAEAGDVPTVMRRVAGNRPRILVLDLNMPGESSLQAIPRILDASPETRIVVLTMQTDPVFAREALGAGALGYVLKEAADTELVDAVRRAANDELYVNPGLGARLVRDRGGGGGEDSSTPLSERELQILGMIAEGYTNAEIADRLTLSVRTVESHRAHIQRKTGRTTRAELVALARDRRLVD